MGAPRLETDNKYAQEIIDTFGDRFTTLARPVLSSLHSYLIGQN